MVLESFTFSKIELSMLLFDNGNYIALQMTYFSQKFL